jgi:hypothetical protein
MQNYFHTDDPRTTLWLANVLSQAKQNGHRVRLSVDSNNNLRVKIEGGMWTAPISSTPDPYRDSRCDCGSDNPELHKLDCQRFTDLGVKNRPSGNCH